MTSKGNFLPPRAFAVGTVEWLANRSMLWILSGVITAPLGQDSCGVFVMAQ